MLVFQCSYACSCLENCLTLVLLAKTPCVISQLFGGLESETTGHEKTTAHKPKKYDQTTQRNHSWLYKQPMWEVFFFFKKHGVSWPIFAHTERLLQKSFKLSNVMLLIRQTSANGTMGMALRFEVAPPVWTSKQKKTSQPSQMLANSTEVQGIKSPCSTTYRRVCIRVLFKPKQIVAQQGQRNPSSPSRPLQPSAKHQGQCSSALPPWPLHRTAGPTAACHSPLYLGRRGQEHGGTWWEKRFGGWIPRVSLLMAMPLYQLFCDSELGMITTQTPGTGWSKIQYWTPRDLQSKKHEVFAPLWQLHQHSLATLIVRKKGTSKKMWSTFYAKAGLGYQQQYSHNMVP